MKKLLLSMIFTLTFAPFAFAANPLVQNVLVSPTPFYVDIPGKSAALVVSYDFNTGGYDTVPVVEEIRNSLNQPVFTFGSSFADDRSTGKVDLHWDGKCNTSLGGEFPPCVAGQMVPEGDYKLYIYAESASPPAATYNSSTFKLIKTVAPTLQLVGTPDDTFYTGSSSPFKLNYKLTRGNDVVTIIRLKITGPSGETVLANESGQDGNLSFSWDGKVNLVTAAAGTYNWTLTATNSVSGYSVDSLPITGKVTVSNGAQPDPTPTPTSTQCAEFKDVKSSDTNCAAISYVKSIGAMTGNPDGTFDASGILQRDQVAKIVLETFNKYNKQQDYCNGNNPFPDVLDSAWSYQYICRGKALSMITGYQSGPDKGMYKPSRSVNRVEFLALLLRNLSDSMPSNDSASYSDVSTGQWYSGYARYSQLQGLFEGSKLNPTNFVNRGEVAKIIYKLHLLKKI